MKESEFIELLNLYVDHEISPADSARLEAEVLANPARHRVYRQYCRMDRGCRLLAEQLREAAPAAASPARPVNRFRWATLAYAGGLMAAACLAAVFTIHFRQPAREVAPASALAAAGRAEGAAAPAAPAPAVEVAALDQGPLHPVIDLRDLSLTGRNAGSDAFLTAEQSQLFAWMNRAQLASMQRQREAIEQTFSPPPALMAPPARPARGSSSLQAPVEMAAFRFQR